MAQGYHDFVPGETLSSANIEEYCQNQSVMRFADSASRDTALSSVKTEGMVSYQLDSNSETIYSGSAWSTIGPLHGAGSSYIPTLTQSGSVTYTNDSGLWRIGRLVIARFNLTVTGSGTGANVVTVSTPFIMWTSSSLVTLGTGMIFDTSANAIYKGVIVPASTGTIQFRSTDLVTNQALGASNFTAALAAGDVVSGFYMFEAASDA